MFLSTLSARTSVRFTLLVFAACFTFLTPHCRAQGEKTQSEKPQLAKPQPAKPQLAKPRMVLQPGHAGTINSMAYSPDGRTLVTAGMDSTLKLWDTSSGDLKATLPQTGELVEKVLYTPRGILVTADGRSEINLRSGGGAVLPHAAAPSRREIHHVSIARLFTGRQNAGCGQPAG